MKMGLEGKVALVTGAARDVGRRNRACAGRRRCRSRRQNISVSNSPRLNSRWTRNV